jgi:hypothetical protein
MGHVSTKKTRKLKQRISGDSVAKRKGNAQPAIKKRIDLLHELTPTRRRKLATERPAYLSADPNRKRKLNKAPMVNPKPKVYPVWHWAWTHPYIMTAFAFGVGSNIATLHLTDLFFGWPFHGLCLLYDAVATCSGFVLAGMCAHTYRDLTKYGHGLKLSD